MLIPKWELVDWWYDSLVTTINPDLNAPPSDHHPCQKHSEDFNDNNGYLIYLELTTTRNDPLINPHDRIQLQGWRANVDLIPILTKQYVSKYASEAEPRSLALSEVLYKALRSDNPNDPAVKAFQKLLIHTVGRT
ncbi:hypothetical protein GLOIN_2v1584803 [Rhizophagus irregularis DAOM 181602=DAOM 197198]|nr:hypothetical protein GLOIN_2v1584803 [Rhizophagus irregularis DAOM 181602=DAOM 197198]